MNGINGIEGSNHKQYRIRSVRLGTGMHIPLLCCDGLPIYGTTLWTLGSLISKGNAFNTMVAKLRAVAHWLALLDRDGEIDWAERTRSGKFLTPGETSEAQKLMGLAVHLNASDKARPKQLRVAVHIQAARVGYLRDYLCWLAQRDIHSMQGSLYAEVSSRFERWCKSWVTDESMETGTNQPSSAGVGLTQEQRELFLTVIKPGNPKNPFEPGMQARNYAIFMMLYEHGMRMGEVLTLRMDDVHTWRRVFVIAARQNDSSESRGRMPGGAKRRHIRERLFSDVSLNALTAWMDNDRVDEARFPKAASSPYVFVSERWNPRIARVNPLSVRRLSALFEILRNRFPEQREGHRLVKAGFDSHFSPHDLRHDWCVRYVLSHYNGWTSQDDLTMRYEMGWSLKSDMPSHYTRVARRELGGKALEITGAARTYKAMELLKNLPV